MSQPTTTRAANEPASASAPEPAAGGAWPDSIRGGDLIGSTVFGSTIFDAPGPAVRVPELFDVCHVGVVLRAVLFVNLAVACAVMFVASSFGAWLSLGTVGAAVALPGVVLWLLCACTLQRVLGKLPLGGQWLAAVLLGAASGLFGWGVGYITQLDVFQTRHWLASALAGAMLAAVMFQWLRLRAQARVPADTTARLAELQSRIRPHFLFNTLNTALSLVRLDPARAEDVLEDLAELFRVALEDTGEAVSLAEEVELAKRYLAIEQIRFGERLRVSWELDPDAGSARVPPLLLQPLVENAVRHGVEPSPQGGQIRVRTRARGGRATVFIANTVPVEPSRPGNGIALRNVRERLRLMHDVAAQFDARQDDKVFRVQIVVPL